MEKIFQVSEFNEYINIYLRQVGEVTIEGEITEKNVSQGRWLFITIKDSQSNLSIFAPVFNISGHQVLEPGMQVYVTGVPGLHPKSGRFSVHATQIIPAGEGALRLAFEKLKLQLGSEGLFAPERKRKPVVYPQNIGLITARNSEAYNDFIKILRERFGGLHIYFYPVNVQGRDSVNTIVQAFTYFNRSNLDLDLLVLTRGGGSLEDLLSFNDEKVVRSIFASRFPVVVGVGHERDISLADLVADVRASTPSNTAELIVPHRRESLQHVNLAVLTMSSRLEHSLNLRKTLLFRYSSSLERAIHQQIQLFKSLITSFKSQFAKYLYQVNTMQVSASNSSDRLETSFSSWLKNKQTFLSQLTRLLGSFDHQKILRRGFSLTYKGSQLIRSYLGLQPGQELSTQLSDGRILSVIKTLNHD